MKEDPVRSLEGVFAILSVFTLDETRLSLMAIAAPRPDLARALSRNSFRACGK